MSYRRCKAAALILAQGALGERHRAASPDREVEDDCLPPWVPPVGRYRTGTPADFGLGRLPSRLGGLRSRQVFLLFSVLISFLFSVFNFEFPI
jgi:hypothetical protein